MNQDVYIATQQMLLNLAQVIEKMDLDDFLKSIEKAESLGPILDPSLYREFLFKGGDKNLDAIKRIAEAAKQIQQVVRELKGSETAYR